MPELDIRFGYPKNERNPEGKPLPTQRRFHQSEKKYRLLAGGFGTGKTTSLILEVIKEALRYPKNYILLGRKDLMELKATTLKELLDILPEELIEDHNKQERTLRLINGTEIYYMNLDDSREATEKIKSLNLGSAAIDQLEEIDENVFLAIQGRLRREHATRNFFATCNPAGHDWMWRRFKAQPGPNYEVFEAITSENIYLPKDYIEELLGYPEKWLKRFFYCSWDDFEGLVYDQFIEAKNVIDYYEPEDWETHIHILDYGFRNPTCILYTATNYDNETVIYDEYYDSGKLISEICDEYKLNKYWRKAFKIADPSIMKTERDGSNVRDEFGKYHVYWNKANNDVSQGINRVNELFKNESLLVTRNCTNLLAEIGNYKWKELKPGQARNEYEEPVKKNDHAMDCIRYLANEIRIPQKETFEVYGRPSMLRKKKIAGKTKF